MGDEIWVSYTTPETRGSQSVATRLFIISKKSKTVQLARQFSGTERSHFSLNLWNEME